MPLTARFSLLLVVLLAAAVGCGKADNSADTDKATADLRKAQGAVDDQGKQLVQSQDDIEAKRRALALEQQQLADKQKLADQQRQELGSAQGALHDARVAYAAAIDQRLAKLDASLATLATKTDAKSKDAITGLRPRRDQLAATLATMTGTPDPGWDAYTKDVDTTFDAIERDLGEALR